MGRGSPGIHNRWRTVLRPSSRKRRTNNDGWRTSELPAIRQQRPSEEPQRRSIEIRMHFQPREGSEGCHVAVLPQAGVWYRR